ncbi:MAG: GNAT family N-acetyltransferase [Rhodospirillaceae bacterium]|nr:GNAT family N-acetyltransferase [Rhodospirillaceae bacterium]
MSEVLVRRLVAPDAATFRAIRLEALRLEPAAFCASHDVEAAAPLEMFAERLERNAVFGAFDDGSILGLAGFLIADAATPQRRGVLWGMYVRSGAQKRGIGSALVAAVIDHARTVVDTLTLGVVKENVAAQQLYERHGFRETGLDRRVLPDGRAITEVLMALRIQGGKATA